MTRAFDSVSDTDGLAVREFDSLFDALAFVGIVFEMRHGKSSFVLKVPEWVLRKISDQLISGWDNTICSSFYNFHVIAVTRFFLVVSWTNSNFSVFLERNLHSAASRLLGIE